MKVRVLTKTKLWINGREYTFEPGIYDLDEDQARILITAKYAEMINEGEKDDNPSRTPRIPKR